MELREIAERILFATSLEEKFLAPREVTDERPGPAIASPLFPGRPAGLKFKSTGERGPGVPSTLALEREGERGRLLHFFANHELLATELMALVLLRFPEAPPDFRRGVWQTLKDEQLHTRLYLDRMRACGVAFGDLPVSGYFWRAVSGMADPMDYVAGLSLTFEQANLDFSREFARHFGEVGDDASARLMERIYRDEIGHVAYGLKWFRKWKLPGESDWDAFRRRLRFPLSPRRARGNVFNAEGRRAAGLDASFIEELSIFARSKGRTPQVFLFNPFAEGYLSCGPSFQPNRHQRQLALDLANLPQFLGRQDDLILVPRRPSISFLHSLQERGVPLPEFVELNDDPRIPESEFENRRLGGLRPWAWGPDSVRLLAPLRTLLSDNAGVAESGLPSVMSRLFSKAWSAGLLRELLEATPGESWLCPPEDVGVSASTMEEVRAAVDAIRLRGHHRLVVKESLGLAGHNAVRLWEPEIQTSQWRWIERATGGGRSVVVEPWLARRLDFSVHWEMDRGGLKLCGYTGLINDHRGQYRANWAFPKCRRCLPASVRDYFPEIRDFLGRLSDWYLIQAAPRLEAGLRREGYVGPVGIDAFVYRTTSGEHRVKPVVEINPRYTMGRLTLELMRFVSPASHGLFEIVPRSRLRHLGFEGFPDLAQSVSARFPLAREGDPVARWREGTLCLNDPLAAGAVLALFHVRRSARELLDGLPLNLGPAGLWG